MGDFWGNERPWVDALLGGLATDDGALRGARFVGLAMIRAAFRRSWVAQLEAPAAYSLRVRRATLSGDALTTLELYFDHPRKVEASVHLTCELVEAALAESVLYLVVVSELLHLSQFLAGQNRAASSGMQTAARRLLRLLATCERGRMRILLLERAAHGHGLVAVTPRM